MTNKHIVHMPYYYSIPSSIVLYFILKSLKTCPMAYYSIVSLAVVYFILEVIRGLPNGSSLRSPAC